MTDGHGWRTCCHEDCERVILPGKGNKLPGGRIECDDCYLKLGSRGLRGHAGGHDNRVRDEDSE